MATATSNSGSMLAMRMRPKLTRLPLAGSMPWLPGCWCNCHACSSAMRKIPAPRGRVQPLPAGRQGSDGSQAPHLGPGELGHALLHKAFMACAKPCAIGAVQCLLVEFVHPQDRKSTRLNSSHLVISYAVFCLKKKKKKNKQQSQW